MPCFDEQILRLRENPENSYMVFCDVVLAQIVGKHDWKVNSGRKKLSEYVTTSNEAFGLLLLENSWTTWKEMAGNADSGQYISNKPLYTLNGAGTKKNGGWKPEGWLRFNELAKMVQEDRNNDVSGFETIYMESKNERGGNARNNSSVTTGDTEFVIYMEDV